jgi:hypothetical protein
MNIREISDVFKNTASEISALKSYNFGWASDRVRVTNAEDFQDLNLYPRLFFSVPTIIASDQTRKQDTYQVTLFFDDLLGYDNEGDEDATMQIDKWATLQNYATAFIQRLNLIKQSILPNYIFIPEAPQFTFDSFTGLQRLITVQVNFNLVVPTNCEVIVQRVINVIGNVIAQGTTNANIFLSNRICASVEAKATVIASLTTGQNVVEVESSVTAFALSSGDIVRVQTISSDVNGQAISDASLQKVLSVVGDLNASGQVNGNIQLTLFVSSSVQANGNVDANIDVISQGVTTVESIVIANAISDANIQLTIPLSSSSSTEAITEANATLTKIIEASSTATAQTDSNAQITISVNAFAIATAQTTSDASLSYTVNADATATANTTSDASIIRIISADALATANSTAEAGVGVTFVASSVATGSVTNAELFRTVTLESSLTANGTTAAAITTAKNVAASVTGAATVTSANLTVIDVDAAAFFARVTNAGGSLTSTEQSAINTLVLDLKTNSIWTKMQAIYPMVGASAAACAQNLKSSSYTGTFGGAITYSANGITSNGTTGYLDTGFNPSLHNSAGSSHLSYYSRTSVTESKVDMGCYDTGYTNPNQLAIHFNAGSSYYNPNNTSDSVVKINESSSQGLFIASRTSSTSIFGKRNNNTETTGTASEARNNVKIFILAASINNNAEFFNTKQCAFASIGDGLSTTDASNLYTIVQTFQTTLSRQV